jgi:hypothetical protein
VAVSVDESLLPEKFVHHFLRIAVLAVHRIIQLLHLDVGDLPRKFCKDCGELRVLL